MSKDVFVWSDRAKADSGEATGHLTFIEDATYSRLIRKYYATEKPLPIDVKLVQRLINARSKEEKNAVVSVLNEFFTLTDQGWRQERCDHEVARFKDKQLKARRSAEGRWQSFPSDESQPETTPNIACVDGLNKTATSIEALKPDNDISNTECND